MSENACRYGEGRDEVLLGYLYEELKSAARDEFDAHLRQCGVCRRELAGLREVRTQLAAWTPPTYQVPSRESGVESHDSGVGSRVDSQRHESWWHAVPAWAQVAAALLFLGVAAGLANLNVHYDQSGLTIRTGWASAPVAVPVQQAAAAPAGTVPWKSDLTALERQLRTEFHDVAAAQQPARSTPTADAETLRRVRALIDESERKQQRDLALRVAEIMRDVDVQRRADLVRISQSLGQIQNNTGIEVMKQRQLLNYYVSMSQKQP